MKANQKVFLHTIDYDRALLCAISHKIMVHKNKRIKRKICVWAGGSCPWASCPIYIQHGRYLETWYLEAGRDLGTSEADTEVGVL